MSELFTVAREKLHEWIPRVDLRDFNIPTIMSSCVLFGLDPFGCTVRLQQWGRWCDNKSPLLLKSAFRRSVRANAFTGRIAVAYKRYLPSPSANAGVPPPYRRFGWSIGSSHRHYYRRRRRQRRRRRRCCHWRRPRGGSSFSIFIILIGSSREIAFLLLNDITRNVPLSRWLRGIHMESTLIICEKFLSLHANRSTLFAWRKIDRISEN